jgi:hypothetical protein
MCFDILPPFRRHFAALLSSAFTCVVQGKGTFKEITRVDFVREEILFLIFVFFFGSDGRLDCSSA